MDKIKSVSVLFGALALLLATPAKAVTPPQAGPAKSAFVYPAFGPPGHAQVCGQDAGLGCTLSVDAGACVLVESQGEWGYDAAPDLFVDGGVGTVTAGTGCTLPLWSIQTYLIQDGGLICVPPGIANPDAGPGLYPLDGGIAVFPDGGDLCVLPDAGTPTEWPDAGNFYATYVDGGQWVSPGLNHLSDGDHAAWCYEAPVFGSSVVACSVDGGTFAVAPRVGP